MNSSSHVMLTILSITTYTISALILRNTHLPEAKINLRELIQISPSV